MNDDQFLTAVADALHGLPTVEAVTLGGSRAQGTHRPDSDWDFAVYYRGDFHPQHLRDLGWEGEVSEVGAWGGGVFNGGAWLRIDDRPVDIHYRDLDVVEEQIAKAKTGEFHVEPLMFHLAGIPSYLVVGELAIHQLLRGALPTTDFPEALRRAAPPLWSGQADLSLLYAEHNHAPYGRLAQCAGLMAVAASQYAHAILAGRGEWVTNEKTLLKRAGLLRADDIVAALTPQPETLVAAVGELRQLAHGLLESA